MLVGFDQPPRVQGVLSHSLAYTLALTQSSLLNVHEASGAKTPSEPNVDWHKYITRTFWELQLCTSKLAAQRLLKATPMLGLCGSSRRSISNSCVLSAEARVCCMCC